MRAAAVLGVTNVWNLGGSDTDSQNLLESLEGNDHGQLLGRIVRLVRLTRPDGHHYLAPRIRNRGKSF